ncbi:TES protein, partial [Pseudoatta argentina]
MEEEPTNRPKWLVELENRKQKPRLAHEAGAGAPCTNCNSMCPGLDLHFWRKICKNCKCGRDDHDVDDDQFPQFDLLFGSSGKFKKKSMRLQVNNKKQNDDETTFEWVPPDTTKELAVDYMKALPTEKLPIKGSVGAVLRRQLLQKQLPLHDIDYKVCDQLSEQEQKQFEKYLENIKKYAGQGKVTKMFGVRPFDRSLMTPVNATDMQKCSPQHKSHILPTGVQLRTPSSFAQKGPYARQNKQSAATVINNNEILMRSTEEYNCTLDVYNVSVGSNIARSQPIEGKLIYENLQRDTVLQVDEKNAAVDNKIVNSSIFTHLAEQEIVSAREKHTCRNYVPCGGNAFEQHGEIRSNLVDTTMCTAVHGGEAINDETVFSVESIFADALLPPSAVHANDIIGSTLDEKGLTFIREKLADKYNNATKNPAMYAVSKFSRPLDTKAISITESSIRNPISTVPTNVVLSAKIEISDSQNPIDVYISNPLQAELSSSVLQSSVIHSEQLQNQVFPHIVGGDMQLTDSLQEAIEGLKIDSTKVHKCEKCHDNIRVGDVVVIAEKANNASWHPGCFVCSVCNELLVDLVYFYYKSNLYCGRDLATFLGIPRCFACDELIFVREYTVAEGHNYHVKHFCCWDCDMPLAGQQYITENDRPLCLPCYQKSYAKTCAACNIVIAADQQGVAIKNLNFHATQVCFCCYSCKRNLLNGRMAIKKDKLFCSKECITKFFN